MQIACSENRNRISASSATNKDNYYCPICGEKLVLKSGSIRVPHFAHCNLSECDKWHYDMTEWHYKWQNQFPIENQEVVFQKNGEKHRADVFINNTILEFQHSDISYDEFYERNEFYNSLGYDVEWIFDVQESNIDFIDYKKGTNSEIYSWKYPKQILQDFNYRNQHVRIFLQIGPNLWDKCEDYNQKEYYDELLEYLEGNIISLDWISPNGLKRFISNKNYDDIEFLSRYLSFDFKQEEKKEKIVFTKNDIGDEVLINGEYDFYGVCPKTSKLYPHKECAFCIHNNSSSGLCVYRFKRLLECNIDTIQLIERDREGRISKIVCCIDGETKEFLLPKMEYSAKSIPELLNYISNARAVRFMNIKTMNKVQMNMKNIGNLKKNNKCYGKLCKASDWNNYSKDEYEVYNYKDPIWVIKWYVE